MTTESERLRIEIGVWEAALRVMRYRYLDSFSCDLPRDLVSWAFDHIAMLRIRLKQAERMARCPVSANPGPAVTWKTVPGPALASENPGISDQAYGEGRL